MVTATGEVINRANLPERKLMFYYYHKQHDNDSSGHVSHSDNLYLPDSQYSKHF